MRHTSRSAMEAFRRCRRKYFYQYAYAGTGVTSPLVYEAMTLGSALHLGMPLLLQAGGVRTEVTKAVAAALDYWKRETLYGFLDSPEDQWSQRREEGEALIEGLLRGWNRTRRVRFLEEYKPIFVEEEIDLVLSPELVFDSRADLIVEDIIGQLWVIDWKSVSRAYDWGSRFKREPQSYTQPHVAEKRLGRKIHGTIYEGLWKGNQSGSILIRGVRSTTESGIYSGVVSDAKRTGMERFDVWKHPFEGIVETQFSPIEYWIDWLPEEIVRDQFLTPQAIPFDRSHAEAWFRQIQQQEEDTSDVLTDLANGDLPAEMALDYFYPSESDWNCQGCQFESICWGGHDIAKLLTEGKFVPRRDHHKTQPS